MKSQVRLRLRRPAPRETAMVFVGGSKTSYRCRCGANVFTKLHVDSRIVYACNGCNEIYEGKR